MFRVYSPFWIQEKKKSKQIFIIPVVASILGFQSKGCYQVLIYKTPCCFLPSFQSITVVSGEKVQNNCFNIGYGTILDLMYKSPRYSLLSLLSLCISVQGKKFKIYFQDGGSGSHLGFPIETILPSFDLQVSSKFLIQLRVTHFRVNLHFRSGLSLR